MEKDSMLEILNDWNFWRKDLNTGKKREKYAVHEFFETKRYYYRSKKIRKIIFDEADGKRIDWKWHKKGRYIDRQL